MKKKKETKEKTEEDVASPFFQPSVEVQIIAEIVMWYFVNKKVRITPEEMERLTEEILSTIKDKRG